MSSRPVGGLVGGTATLWVKRCGRRLRGTADQRCTVIYEELAEGQLRELEPQPLPAEMPSELRVHSVAFRFNPARYLRFCSRVLTASRAAIR